MFIGRAYEEKILQREYLKDEASFVILYGRRRIGKSRLVNEFYKDKNLWRFEGLEGLSTAKQIRAFLTRLSEITKNPVYHHAACPDWMTAFGMLDQAIKQSPGKYNKTIFFDELPYMAAKQEELVSVLKWAWDNLWSQKKDFTLVLCGSVASFMIQKVVKSSALYGRITLEINLKPLSLNEVSAFFGHKKSIREIASLYMFCGGVPEYLKQINPKESVAQNIARLSFLKDGYFVGEFGRLFKDILAEELVYKKIISLLARYKSLKIPEMAKTLHLSPGGGFVDYMENLESAGFVKTLVPLNRKSETRLKRFVLDDEYLLFYFQFVEPHLRQIQNNTSLKKGLNYLISPSYNTWAGFAFERMCLKHIPSITKALEIDQLVKEYGPYFDRASNKKEGVQIDLLFERHDPVVTLCEMKYVSGLVGKPIIREIEKKAALLGETKKTIEKVLITTEGITKDLADAGYFSKVLTLENIFKKEM